MTGGTPSQGDAARERVPVYIISSIPAGSAGSEHLSPPVLVESHRDLGHVPHPPRLTVPGGARVEPALVLDTSRAGQAT